MDIRQTGRPQSPYPPAPDTPIETKSRPATPLDARQEGQGPAPLLPGGIDSPNGMRAAPETRTLLLTIVRERLADEFPDGKRASEGRANLVAEQEVREAVRELARLAAADAKASKRKK